MRPQTVRDVSDDALGHVAGSLYHLDRQAGQSLLDSPVPRFLVAMGSPALDEHVSRTGVHTHQPRVVREVYLVVTHGDLARRHGRRQRLALLLAVADEEVLHRPGEVLVNA